MTRGGGGPKTSQKRAGGGVCESRKRWSVKKRVARASKRVGSDLVSWSCCAIRVRCEGSNFSLEQRMLNVERLCTCAAHEQHMSDRSETRNVTLT